MGSAGEVSFSMYVAIMGQSAMMQMGKIINPATGKIERDLAQAKFTIDVLGMLEEKTRGNLTKDESELLRTTLANLRLNYVEELEEEKKRQEKEKKDKESSKDKKVETKEKKENEKTKENDKDKGKE